MKFPALYKRTSTGAIQQWTIEVVGDSYITSSGQVGGAITVSSPTVCEAKNTDKANATTGEEQALKEAQAKYDKQLKSKYKLDVSNIDTKDFISPTLAEPLKKRTKPVVYPAYIQTKYNGVCCIIDSEFGSRSRKGEIFYNIKHINRDLEQFFNDNPDVVLHGELFNNDLRENLNRLIKLVAVTRKEKDLTPELIKESEEIVRFYVYDGYIKGKEHEPYKKRIKDLHERINGLIYVISAPTHVVNNEEDTIDFFNANIADKQEGAILRMMDMPYVHKRTQDIIKYKKFDSAEYLCIGFDQGTGNYAGLAKKCVMVLPNGKTLNCNMRGDQTFLKHVWENQEQYTNKYYTCDYQDMSEYGIPQIAYTGLIQRTYE
jgi:ATP-dependent DNA ligase